MDTIYIDQYSNSLIDFNWSLELINFIHQYYDIAIKFFLIPYSHLLDNVTSFKEKNVIFIPPIFN